MRSESIVLDEHVLLTTNRKYFEICSFVQFGCLKVQYTHTTISFIDLKISFKVESFLKIQNFNFSYKRFSFLFFFIGILTYIIINLIQLFYFSLLSFQNKCIKFLHILFFVFLLLNFVSLLFTWPKYDFFFFFFFIIIPKIRFSQK